MKTVNAAIVPDSRATCDLRDRRYYGSLDVSSIKRAERRASRRALSRELARNVYPGIERDFGAPLEHFKPTLVKVGAREFQVPPEFLAKPAANTRAVTVVRKLGRQRIVETLRIAA